MHGSCVRTLIGVVVALSVFVTSPSHADWLHVTNCEMVTIDGHEYGKLTFDISNNATGLNFGELGDLLITPYPGNSALIPFVSVTMPAGWSSMQLPDGYYWRANGPANVVHPGQSLSGIQIVLSQPQVCYAFEPPSVLLSMPAPSLYLPVCFACPGVTPASESTWGRVKQTYR